MQAGKRGCSGKESEHFLRNIRLTLEKTLVNPQNIMKRCSRSCVERQSFIVLHNSVCECIKKISKENNLKKTKSSEIILEMVGEVLKLYMHRISKSCCLVLWQVETKYHPILFILCLCGASTCLQVFPTEVCYFWADTNPRCSYSEYMHKKDKQMGGYLKTYALFFLIMAVLLFWHAAEGTMVHILCRTVSLQAEQSTGQFLPEMSGGI